MDIEAVVLTGGASRRMGEDKAMLLIEGESQAVRILSRLQSAGFPCTVLGSERVPGYSFYQDAERFQGPLCALRRFEPTHEYVFVTSCDVPLFNPLVIDLLRSKILDSDACVPVIGGLRQPLSALYCRRAFDLMKGHEGKSIDKFLKLVAIETVNEHDLAAAGIPLSSIQSANTREELETIVGKGVNR